MALTTAFMMVALLGFAALAVDVAYLFVVRNELQNAADAAALAGAACLYPRSECVNLTATAPDWNTASSRATTSIPLNQSANTTLHDGVVEYGYWNLTGTPKGLQSLPYVAGSNDLPAVRVTISKDSGVNNGAASVFFAKVLGFGPMPVSAQATAVVTSPGYVGPNGLFPVALNQCMYNALEGLWDPTTDQPKTATSTNPSPPLSSDQTIQQVIGQPYRIEIGSSYHVDQSNSCQAGQWTSLTTGAQAGASTLTDWINALNNPNATANTEPSASIGDNIFIQSGTVASVYKAVDACSALDGNGRCGYEIFPIVSNLTTGQNTPIIAFACLKIDSADQANKYIVVELASSPDKCQAVSAGGNGPVYGALTPPRLVQ